MNMFDERFHILDIHLSIRIESDKSFNFQLISISFDEIVSCLISCPTSSIDGMRKNDYHNVRILMLLFIQGRYDRRAITDKHYFPEPCSNNIINHSRNHRSLFIIHSDIENEIILFSYIFPTKDLFFVFIISFVDSHLRNESGQLKRIFGLSIECIDIEVEKNDKRDIYQKISTSRDTKKSSELIQQLLIQRKNHDQPATDDEHDKVKDIHLLAFVEIHTKKNEYNRSKHYDKLKQ